MKNLFLNVLDGPYCVLRLPANEEIPAWALKTEGFSSISRSKDELSIVVLEKLLPPHFKFKVELGWRCLKVKGILDFSLTGILASIANPLAQNKISIFAVSTFDTDYILLKSDQFDLATSILSEHGIKLSQE